MVFLNLYLEAGSKVHLLNRPSRRALDKLQKEYILHLEFQLEHQAGFPRRMCGYYGALTEQLKQPVMTLALYLKPRRSPIPNEYVVTLGERVVNRFTTMYGGW